MNPLVDYVLRHTTRGACQCGRCIDKQPGRKAPAHSVSVYFFWVSATNNPTADEFSSLIEQHYGTVDRLKQGPSYIEIGAALGDQGVALLFMGLGAILGLWTVVTPDLLGARDKQEAKYMVGSGYLMISGYHPPNNDIAA